MSKLRRSDHYQPPARLNIQLRTKLDETYRILGRSKSDSCENCYLESRRVDSKEKSELEEDIEVYTKLLNQIIDNYDDESQINFPRNRKSFMKDIGNIRKTNAISTRVQKWLEGFMKEAMRNLFSN